MAFLYERVRFIRNAVLCYSLAVGSFVITSIWIGLGLVVRGAEMINSGIASIIFFVIGMILVLIGITFAARESIKGFDIIELELKADE